MKQFVLALVIVVLTPSLYAQEAPADTPKTESPKDAKAVESQPKKAKLVKFTKVPYATGTKLVVEEDQLTNGAHSIKKMNVELLKNYEDLPVRASIRIVNWSGVVLQSLSYNDVRSAIVENRLGFSRVYSIEDPEARVLSQISIIEEIAGLVLGDQIMNYLIRNSIDSMELGASLANTTDLMEGIAKSLWVDNQFKVSSAKLVKTEQQDEIAVIEVRAENQTEAKFLAAWKANAQLDEKDQKTQTPRKTIWAQVRYSTKNSQMTSYVAHMKSFVLKKDKAVLDRSIRILRTIKVRQVGKDAK